MNVSPHGRLADNQNSKREPNFGLADTLGVIGISALS